MAGYSQDRRRFGITTPLGKDGVLLSRFDGDEPMSGLFSYSLQLVSENDDIEAISLVGKEVAFWIQHPDDQIRLFRGLVSRFQYLGRDDRLSNYSIQVVPWLWLLSLNSDCRIFQQMSIPDIYRKVLKERGFTDFDDSQVRGSYPPLEYCVQYNESDFAFLSRLLEEAGIFYYFRHEKERLLMVLADSTSGCKECKDGKIEFSDNLSERSLGNQVWKWNHRCDLRPGRWTHTDYNFKTPTSDMLASVPTRTNVPKSRSLEVYEYPGRFDVRAGGDQYARVRMEAEESAVDVVDGESYCRSFSPGVRFTVTKHHAKREVGKEYIVTQVSHSLDASAVYVTGRSSATEEYSNSFQCVPATAPYRPPRQTAIPRVRGPQTAVVVGPAGEEIYTDEFGRVKVQFHWDREGKRNENSSCWIRVSQVHAGAGWGMMDLPRIGEEVIVSFLEGDPDRPIITGRVYNGMNQPPFSLPAEKTRRGNSTKTYKGAGFNEMSMDDTPGKEQLRMNAQYDMNSNVNHDQTLDVGNNQTEKVAVDRTREVGNNESITVGVNKDVSIGVNDTENVGANQTVTVGANQSTTVGTNQSNSVGMMKSETVGVISNEAVGVSKSLEVGASYAIVAGLTMTTKVGTSSSEETGTSSSETIGTKKSLNVGDEFSIVCGSSKLTMKKDGTISIEGKDILIKGSGKITAKASGDMVLKGSKIGEN